MSLNNDAYLEKKGGVNPEHICHECANAHHGKLICHQNSPCNQNNKLF